MSQTWVIKDTAPVDEASYVFTKTDILFTSGGEKFVGIEMFDEGMTHVGLAYYRNDGTVQIAATMYYGDSGFTWTADNEKYKTIIFDTAPTGELLAWLQKNADLIKDEETHRYQDLHLTDIDLNTQFKQYMSTGQYEAALAILQNDQLTDKMVVADLFNYVTSRIVAVQSMSDPTFKQDVIKVATQPPAGMTSGQVYFKLKE